MNAIHYRISPIAALALILFLLPIGSRSNAQTTGPFGTKTQKAQIERVREYDLKNVLLRLKVNWEWRMLSGTVTETLAPLTDDLKTLAFDCGNFITVTACKVNDTAAKFTIADDKLNVTPPDALKKDAAVNVSITYFVKGDATGQGIFGFGRALHWVEPDKFDPKRNPAVWTHGEPEDTHEWIPIYDYPNDKTMSETYIEVPESWYMVSNGKLLDIANDSSLHTKTFHYKMTQPFSTYLLSLAGGEMDVVTDKWEDIDLVCAVPKGMGNLIPASFGYTKNTLTFFSERFGVKYAWPKYAQTAVWDFYGGMENVSATLLGANMLVSDARDYALLNETYAHELSHQWFGDMVTCRDWGNLWLNEGFAVFMEMIYREHCLGKDSYDYKRWDYWNTGRRYDYERPIVTHHFYSPGSMVDDVTYKKGGVMLHTLRHVMGDDAFFKGLGHYLTKHAYTNVDTQDLAHALEESSGQKLQAFFDQWVYKPGHPVLKYEWNYDPSAKQVNLHIAQKQDTRNETPIYTIDLPVAFLSGGQWTQTTVALNKAEQDFALPCTSAPISLLLDPGHDFPIERIGRDHPGEAEADLTFAPCCVDRLLAANALIKTEHGALQVLAAALKELGNEAATAMVKNTERYRRVSFRPAYRALLRHKDASRRAAAIRALGYLPKTAEDEAALRGLINDKEPYDIVIAALESLARMDADGNIAAFKAALAIPSQNDYIAGSALTALSRCHSAAALPLLLAMTTSEHPRRLRLQSLGYLQIQNRARVTALLYKMLNDADPMMQQQAIEAFVSRHEIDAAPALQRCADTVQDNAVRNAALAAVKTLENEPIAAKNGPMPSALLPH